MSIFDDLSDMMPDTVQIRPRTGENAGDPVYGAYISYSPCQVFQGPIRFRNEDGDLISANGQIILAASPKVAGDSQAKLPDGSLATVKSVRVYPDEVGSAFQVVYLV